MIDAKKIQDDFPIFRHHRGLVYLDGAASTQTPDVVVKAMQEYYEHFRSNVHRGIYRLSGEATERYEAARAAVAGYIGAESSRIVFTSGATASLNILAYAIAKTLRTGDNVVLSEMEHHANIVPWQMLSKQYGFEIRYIRLTDALILQEDLPIDEKTKVVSVTYVSNTLGTVNPVPRIMQAAKNVGAIGIVDAAQAIAHMPIDVNMLGCDALVFSGHKMYGPTGIGVLYGTRELLEKLDPVFFGGDMVKMVTFEDATWNDVPYKFEPGTPPVAGALGLAAAVRYLEKAEMKQIQKHEAEITAYALEKLKGLPEVTVLGSPAHRIGIIAFTLSGIHPHDVATVLDEDSIAVRAGHHCTMPLHALLGLPGSVRISIGIYTSREDIDRLVAGLKKTIRLFSPPIK